MDAVTARYRQQIDWCEIWLNDNPNAHQWTIDRITNLRSYLFELLIERQLSHFNRD